MDRIKSPGELIREEMEARGWTQRDLAAILGRPLPAINEVIQGKRAITPEMAVGLAGAFGIEAARWLHLEADYRLGQTDIKADEIARRAKLYSIAPVKDMEKRGWIAQTETAEELEVELRRFYEVPSLESEPEISASFRKTAADHSMNIAQRAWCFRAKRLAQSVAVAPFSDEAFDKGIKKLRRLVGWPEESRKVSRILAEMGIRFVVVEPLPHTKIDGVAFWLDPLSPVIALSIRFDRIDSFWHTLGHELSHIRHRDDPAVDTDIVGESRLSPVEQTAIERRADTEASSMWLDAEELQSFILRVGPLYSRARINQFANRLVVHPGIIVGQLQFRGELGYQALRDTLVRVRDAVTSEAATDGWGFVLASERTE
jgi:HTH-type transcriptional regulator / antitoxin HigA